MNERETYILFYNTNMLRMGAVRRQLKRTDITEERKLIMQEVVKLDNKKKYAARKQKMNEV